MRYLVQLCLLGVLLGFSGPEALAQSHTVKIENGQVFIDGMRQAEKDLPASLELDGVTASLSFSGSAQFRLGGQIYEIVDGRLLESEGGDGAVSFILGDSRQGRLAFLGTSRYPTNVGQDNDGPISVYYDMLDGHLANLKQLNTEYSVQQSPLVAERLGREAEQAALMVQAFPRLELETYLSDIKGSNQPLYDDLLREHMLEMETMRLASRIRSTADESRRASLQRELKQQLEAAFELKQQNRREEIAQLDARLTDLRAQMDERQARRDEIIARRIRQLLEQRD
jgi:hypothetical protein